MPSPELQPRVTRLQGKSLEGTRVLVEGLARRYGAHPLMRHVVIEHVVRPAGVRPNDLGAASEAIHAWVRDRVDFWPESGEQVLTPARVLIWRYGDCDDRAGLVAAMHEALRVRWRLVVGHLGRADQAHLWPEVHVRGAWWPVETSDPRARWGEHPVALVARIRATPF